MHAITKKVYELSNIKRYIYEFVHPGWNVFFPGWSLVTTGSFDNS